MIDDSLSRRALLPNKLDLYLGSTLGEHVLREDLRIPFEDHQEFDPFV